MLLFAVWINALQPREAEVRIAAAQVLPEEVFDPGVERSVLGAEALIVDTEELVEVLLDEVFEIVGGALGPVARERKCRQGEGRPPPR